MYPELKNRASRLKTLSEELIKLWNTLSFPALSEQRIFYKVDETVWRTQQKEAQNKELKQFSAVCLILQNLVVLDM